MINPLISCIIPTYNGEKFLREAIDSILEQTYWPIEIIVADDGSKDGTAAVAKSYGDPVRFITQETAGPAATRNLGIQAAKGEFLAFLDADDLWHPEKLERQFAHFQEQPKLDLCVTYAQMFWPEDLKDEAERYQHYARSQPIPGYATTTLLARRSIFEKIGAFDTEYWFADATEWFIRAKEQGMIMELLDDVLTYHRMHKANLTRRMKAKSRDEFLQLVKRALDRTRAR